MDILSGLGQVPTDMRDPVVTIGVFDGVHRGHQKLIRRAVNVARETGVECVVMTFDPHPVKIFAPEHTPETLVPLAERARLIGELGVDHLLVIDFTKELAGESPEEYFRSVIVDTLHASRVVVGENFTFGAGASGTAQTMLALGEKYGVDVDVVSLLFDGTERICSTAIRDALRGGDVTQASEFLGREFSVTAVVERGAGRGGRELGYPTANQYAADTDAVPGDGVYAGWFTVLPEHDEYEGADGADGTRNGDGVSGSSASLGPIVGDMEPGIRYPAAISVGTNPTFGDHRRSIESFVLDRDADLYGRTARVEFIAKVRDMVKFDSVDELLENMARDVARVRQILS
ncbi:bifunctional riboflavin kinase/FAD synthetase [Corynebacterium sp. P3-F1]|uniref:bifunctional riboflavin kinase/FAD synthetase n=1 Tax=Corynebacterium sp. P3-F1 TaxID=3059080 RepID=UPI00265CF148|nr:bifunctional riboflavin kinase/FAD synthetase [Corynebacterium sp. P3-F1]WKK61736.1 bifunctional riboflavin kinase/FAD synthetase [Corynebacterium sp. P3-F1]